MTGPDFHPDAVYRINIDTDGDAHADAAFTFTFSELENGAQTGTAYYATGPQARRPEPAGQVLIQDTCRTTATRPRRPGRPPASRCPTSCLRPHPAGQLPQRPRLTDDVYSARFAWLTNGKVTSDGLKPHDDLQAGFPYLGLPNP